MVRTYIAQEIKISDFVLEEDKTKLFFFFLKIQEELQVSFGLSKTLLSPDHAVYLQIKCKFNPLNNSNKAWYLKHLYFCRM